MLLFLPNALQKSNCSLWASTVDWFKHTLWKIAFVLCGWSLFRKSDVSSGDGVDGKGVVVMYRRYKKKIELFKRKLMNTILPMNNWTILMKWDYLDWVSLILNWHVKVNPNTNCFLSPQITFVLSRVRNDSYMSLQRTKSCVHAKSLQLCPTLCDPMDYSPLGSSVHGNRQEYRMGCYTLLQGIFWTQGSSQRLLCLMSLMSPALAGRFFTTSAT